MDHAAIIAEMVRVGKAKSSTYSPCPVCHLPYDDKIRDSTNSRCIACKELASCGRFGCRPDPSDSDWSKCGGCDALTCCDCPSQCEKCMVRAYCVKCLIYCQRCDKHCCPACDAHKGRECGEDLCNQCFIEYEKYKAKKQKRN